MFIRMLIKHIRYQTRCAIQAQNPPAAQAAQSIGILIPVVTSYKRSTCWS